MATFGDLPTEVAQKCVEFLAFEEATEVGRYEAEWGPQAFFGEFYEYAS